MHVMDETKLAKICFESNFDEAMDKLRSECFPSASMSSSSADQFDKRSIHMVLRVDDNIAAYFRLTPGPNSVFETWTQGKAKIPTGKEVIDLGRLAINPLYRGINLFEPMLAAALIYAYTLGFKYVVGAFRVGRKLINGSYKFGMLESGEPVYDIEPNGNSVFIQPVLFVLNQSNREIWLNILKSNVIALKEKGYLLDYDILNTIDKIKNPNIFQDIGATAFFVIHYKNEGKSLKQWANLGLINGKTTSLKSFLYRDKYIDKLADNIPSSYVELAKSCIKNNPIFGPAHAIRQRYFNRTLSAAVKSIINNATQIIIFGAGFDTRAIRKRKYNIRFFEIDLPHVIQAKKTIYSQLNFDENAKYIAIDYTNDNLLDELIKHDVNPMKPTHIIWEGNIVYLTLKEICNVILKLDQFFKNRITLSFDYHSDKAVNNQTEHSNLENYTSAVANAGPKFRTGISNIYDFAHEMNLDIIEDFSFRELIEYYGVDNMPDPMLDYFHCCTVSFRNKRHNLLLNPIFYQVEHYRITFCNTQKDLQEFINLNKMMDLKSNIDRIIKTLHGSILIAKKGSIVLGGVILNFLHQHPLNYTSFKNNDVCLKCEFPDLIDKPYFRLSHLCFLANYNEQNVQHKLIDLALKSGKERGYKYMILSISSEQLFYYQKLFSSIGYKLIICDSRYITKYKSDIEDDNLLTIMVNLDDRLYLNPNNEEQDEIKNMLQSEIRARL